MTKAVRNFLRGVGSVIDLCPVEERSRVRELEERPSDFEALAGDWKKVGVAMSTATARFDQESGSHVRRKQR